MIKKSFLLFVFTSFLFPFAILGCSFGAAQNTPIPTNPANVSNDGLTIVLGDISDDPGEVIDGTQPLADYLAEKLADFGYTAGEVHIAATLDEMIQLMRNGEVDLYFDSVYPATLVSDASGGQLFLRRWRFGVETYHTVIFTGVDSGIISIDQLAGHIVAMDAPYSTSGFLLPAVYLVESGQNLVGKKFYNDSVADDEVGFVFSYDDENTLRWVTNGLVSAGATDDYNFDEAFSEETRDKLVILARTETVPRQVVVARPGLDDQLLEAIRTILLNIHLDEAGKLALEPFQTTKFDEFPEGIEAAQEHMREMMQVVQELPMP